MSGHPYTVDVYLVGAEPYRCVVCGRWRQDHDPGGDMSGIRGIRRVEDRRVIVTDDGPDWRSLFVRAVKAFEEERPDVWLDDEFGVPLPELADSKARYQTR